MSERTLPDYEYMNRTPQ